MADFAKPLDRVVRYLHSLVCRSILSRYKGPEHLASLKLMIRKFKQIKAFGVFTNFTWPADLPEFKRFNLIYGWNYSGKTTLSRVLRCFEQGKGHEDFPRAEAHLISSDGSTHQLANAQNAPILRVFNSDFVRENLRFDTGSATPILVLGAEDIAKQESLKLLRAERVSRLAEKAAIDKEKADKTADIERGLTAYARDAIKNPLTVVGYDKTRFEPVVLACKDSPETYILDEAALGTHLSVYQSKEKKPSLTSKTSAFSSLTGLRRKTVAILERTVTATTPIARLSNEPLVEEWVNAGRPLHQGKEVCQFCNQTLPTDLLNTLAGHFSAAYDTLMADIQSLCNAIDEAQAEEVSLDHKGDFYPEIAGSFEIQQRLWAEAVRTRKAALGVLIKALESKKTRAFSALSCPDIDNPEAALDASLKEINDLIAEHNKRSDEFDTKRAESLRHIERHHASIFVVDKRYKENKNEIKALGEKGLEIGKRIAAIDIEIHALEQSLSEASRGAEQINDLLAAYFGKRDLQIAVNDVGDFHILRQGVLARNLSEGEKTAIAFTHFITLVRDGRHPLKDIRVVIDDPISSLDASHIFNTYALIKVQLAECFQLIVLTHNFEFYNLIREWAHEDEDGLKKPPAQWKHWGIFLLKRLDDGTALLKCIPKELLIFKSEYHYLFSLLLHFESTERR